MNPPAASASAATVLSSGESSKAPGKVRAACNRCRSQKLRCVRKIGCDSCERCLKLKTICRFGPRTSRGSLKPREPVAGLAEVDCYRPPFESTTVVLPLGNPDPIFTDMRNWPLSLDGEISQVQEQGRFLRQHPKVKSSAKVTRRSYSRNISRPRLSYTRQFERRTIYMLAWCFV
jgi:hypothetical protein